jgi:hypothetical protein
MKSFFEFYHKLKEDVNLQNNPDYFAKFNPLVRGQQGGFPGNAENPQGELFATAKGVPAGYGGFIQYQQMMQAKGKNPGALQDQDYQKNKEFMTKALGSKYPQFASLLGQNVSDPKIIRYMQLGLQDGDPQDDIISFSEQPVACNALIPTQREIDINKSLGFPLSQTPTDKVLAYLQGGKFAPGGPIVTCCGFKYVIDGHHRWSQLYCMNPKNQIECVDMQNKKFGGSPDGADNALKAALMGSVAMGTYSSETVDSINLIGISQGDLYAYVAKALSPQAKEAFKQFMAMQGGVTEHYRRYFEQDQMAPAQNAGGVDPVTAFAQKWIWGNVQQMNQNNRPVEDAPSRSFMPQTGSAVKTFANKLSQGGINWNTDA